MASARVDVLGEAYACLKGTKGTWVQTMVPPRANILVLLCALES